MAPMPKTTTPRKPAPPATVSINVALPKDVHTKLRLYCVQHDLVLADVVTAALKQFL